MIDYESFKDNPPAFRENFNTDSDKWEVTLPKRKKLKRVTALYKIPVYSGEFFHSDDQNFMLISIGFALAYENSKKNTQFLRVAFMNLNEIIHTYTIPMLEYSEWHDDPEKYNVDSMIKWIVVTEMK